jgi:hypothetical protein
MVVEHFVPVVRISGESTPASPGFPERATPAAASAPLCRNCLRDIPIENFSFRWCPVCQVFGMNCAKLSRLRKSMLYTASPVPNRLHYFDMSFRGMTGGVPAVMRSASRWAMR